MPRRVFCRVSRGSVFEIARRVFRVLEITCPGLSGLGGLQGLSGLCRSKLSLFLGSFGGSESR